VANFQQPKAPAGALDLRRPRLPRFRRNEGHLGPSPLLLPNSPTSRRVGGCPRRFACSRKPPPPSVTGLRIPASRPLAVARAMGAGRRARPSPDGPEGCEQMKFAKILTGSQRRSRRAPARARSPSCLFARHRNNRAKAASEGPGRQTRLGVQLRLRSARRVGPLWSPYKNFGVFFPCWCRAAIGSCPSSDSHRRA